MKPPVGALRFREVRRAEPGYAVLRTVTPVIGPRKWDLRIMLSVRARELPDGGLRYRERFAAGGGSALWRSPASCRSRSGATSRPVSCRRARCASLTPHGVLDPLVRRAGRRRTTRVTRRLSPYRHRLPNNARASLTTAHGSRSEARRPHDASCVGKDETGV